MKKTLVCILIITLFSQNVKGQIKNDSLKIAIRDSIKTAILDSIKKVSTSPSTKPIGLDSIKPTEKRLKFGCGFGVNFVGGTNLNVSPNLTYKLSKQLTIGTGLQGSYSAIKSLQNTLTFGANIIGTYNPIKSIQTLLEFTQLRVRTINESTPVKATRNFWDSGLFIGAGYNINNKITLGAKYNLLYKENKSVYTSAIVPFINIVF